MIQANELRIKNLLEFNGAVMEVASIHCDNTIRFYNKEKTDTIGCFRINECKPIPLTEQWLLEFGFTYNGWNYDLGRFTFHAQGTDENGSFYNTEFYIMKNSTKELLLLSYQIDHVHQIQNLYFALTNQELTLNP